MHLRAVACLAALVATAAAVAASELVEQRFALSGVACHEGSRSVQMAVGAVPGVESVRVLVHAREMVVRFDEARTNPAAIAAAVAQAAPAGRSGDYGAVPEPARTP